MSIEPIPFGAIVALASDVVQPFAQRFPLVEILQARGVFVANFFAFLSRLWRLYF
jgi:hypothetical protein